MIKSGMIPADGIGINKNLKTKDPNLYFALRQMYRRRRGAVDWDAYWATLVSATVENAAPTHVVLTFPEAQESLTDTDFTIAGFTISSASWTGAVLTLVLSESVLVFHEELTITFVQTGTTATVTNNVVDDGNTVAWYDSQDLTTITKDVSQHVTRVNNKLGVAASDLKNVLGTPHWSTSGILFDGTGDKLVTDAFTYNQPEEVFAVMRQVTYTNPEFLMDGVGANMILYQNGVTPRVYLNAGTDLMEYRLPVNKFEIVRLLFNGNGSETQICNRIKTAGAGGTQNAGGICLGARRNNTLFSNWEFKELIFRDAASDAATKTAIYKYLSVKHEYSFDNGKLIITFDDSGSSQYNAFTIMQEKGVAGTFFTISDLVGTASALTWTQLQAMNAAGMDIQCHTKDSDSLEGLTEEQVLAKYQGVNDAFALNSLPAPVHTAYPQGFYSDNIITWTATKRLTGRNVVAEPVNRKTNKYGIGGFGLDAATDFDVFKTNMLAAQSHREAFVCVGHGIGGAQIPEATFRAMIDYAISIGMDVITFSQLYALMD